MNLSDGEKKLFSLFLDDLTNRMSNAGCNDLEKKFVNCLSKEEWIAVSKQFWEGNNCPEQHQDKYADCMMYYMVLYYLCRKLNI